MSSSDMPRQDPSPPPSSRSLSLRSRRSDFKPAAAPIAIDPPATPSSLPRRGSRLGLRHIFSRSKLTKVDLSTSATNISTPLQSQEVARSPKPTSDRPSGFKQSYAVDNDTLSSVRATAALAELQPNSPSADSSQTAYRMLGSLSRANKRKASLRTAFSEEQLSSCESPPLFQAYPQAIRQASLPAITITADALIRINERAGSVDSTTESTAIDLDELSLSKGNKDKLKKKTASKTLLHNFQWTSKIYLLTTTGYLLQYPADGHYNCNPEKILKLSSVSAAFVTDLIPGQHWVLQVSSTAETETPSESRSLFSKLSSHLYDNRRVSNLLMVFENPSEMDTWISAVRTEIEKLGGRKKTSETGVQETIGRVPQIREQPSQRTLVTRDPNRFNQKPVHNSEAQLICKSSDEPSVVVASIDIVQELSLDDGSTTNSVVSNEGRQLDNLRDSTNRLSIVSLSQRTVVTSSTSSPAPSPTIESFSPKSDKAPAVHNHTAGHPVSTVKPRPNASALKNRRASLQSGRLYIQTDGDLSVLKRQSSASALQDLDANTSPSYTHLTPNFSVPTSSLRRYSHSRSSSSETSIPPSPPREKMYSRRPSRGKPPPSMRTSRPLSMVSDQPLPHVTIAERPGTAKERARPLTPIGQGTLSPVRPQLLSPKIPRRSLSACRLSVASDDGSLSPTLSIPRYLSNLGAFRRHGEPLGGANIKPHVGELMKRQHRDSHVDPLAYQKKLRRASSFDPLGISTQSPQAQSHKTAQRASMRPHAKERLHQRHSSCDVDWTNPKSRGHTTPPPPRAPPPSAPLPPIPAHSSVKPHRPVDRSFNKLHARKSMLRIAINGPPPAPPPMRSLPPIPQR